MDQLRNIEKNLNITIPYPYNINIFSHLYILLSRSRKSPDFPFSKQIDQEKTEMMKKDEDLNEVAEMTVHHMERYLHQSLPDIEVYFLYQSSRNDVTGCGCHGTIFGGVLMLPSMSNPWAGVAGIVVNVTITLILWTVTMFLILHYPPGLSKR
ncbi:PRD domain-containing protein [Salibacterium sp. K-3]